MLAALALASAAIVWTVQGATVPSYSFAGPKPFLGLEDAFTDNVGHIIFLPGFHACGSLLVLSVNGLEYDDFSLLPADGADTSLARLYDSAASKAQEAQAREDQILAWAQGWKNTCRPNNVQVAKVAVDALKDTAIPRADAVMQLDEAVQVHLSSLLATSQQHMVVLTTVSSGTLRQLFDLASTTPVTRPPASQRPQLDIPKHRQRDGSFLSRLVSQIVSMVIWGSLAGLVFLGYKAWQRRQSRKRGIALSDGDELDLEAETDR